jgi:uncharacterized protein (TIRG00374 family)
VTEASTSTRPRLSVGRVLLLAGTALCLYLFAPSIAEVFEAWNKLGEVHPAVVPVIVLFEVASFACIWMLQRLALRTHAWFPVVTTQLAGNSFNRITPGGGATGTALQARMLVDAGYNPAKAGTGITVQSLLITAAVLAMPVFALPAIVLGTNVPGSLADAAWIGLIVFAVMAGAFYVLLSTRRPLVALGVAIEAVANRLRFHRPPISGMPDRLLKERDEIRRTLGARWMSAVATAIGRWFFEYLVLLVTLYGIGASPDMWLVLLAFVAASILGMIPLTPGGLGFVEAGLVGTLALSGITTAEAVLATLVFRLVSFWLPIPVGFGAWALFRRRYPRARRHSPIEHST